MDYTYYVHALFIIYTHHITLAAIGQRFPPESHIIFQIHQPLGDRGNACLRLLYLSSVSVSEIYIVEDKIIRDTIQNALRNTLYIHT